MSPTQSAGHYSLSSYRQTLLSASSLLSLKVGAMQNPNQTFTQTMKSLNSKQKLNFVMSANESGPLISKDSMEDKVEISVNSFFLLVKLRELIT